VNAWPGYMCAAGTDTTAGYQCQDLLSQNMIFFMHVNSE
jgi:hypothetical protein